MKTQTIDDVNRLAGLERSADELSLPPSAGRGTAKWSHWSRLNSGERHRLLVEWNRTEAEFPKDKCVHELFEDQVVRTPTALAVADDKQQLTYRELNERADWVAEHLRELGIAPDARVGVCAVRSVEMVIGKLAVCKAGGAYVPLDPAYPRERLSFMIQDAGITVVLTQSSLRDPLKLEAPGLKILCVDEIINSPEHRTSNIEHRTSNPGSLAYVIYTSGSTGVPKGVEIEHAGLVNLVAWHCRTYQVTSEDRASQVAAMGFDATVWEIWPYLTCGASLHICDEETRLSARKLVRWLTDRGITLAFLPTPVAEATFDEVWPAECRLRALLTGGDKLHRPPPENFPCGLFNHYGPTENTVVTTWTRISPDRMKTKAPSIGRPIANTRVYVLDENLAPVAAGEIGELHIGGVGLARGYLNRPELTAQKFISSPFAAGARLYKTGDLVRWLPEGELEFVGRSDHQVKIRGNRVEPGEIESALRYHEAVREAIVMARPDGANLLRLVAYVLVQPGMTVSGAELREFLKQRLPEYMQPAAFVFLDAFPLTHNGKVDRQALPAPVFETETEYIAPRTRAEETLISIWREVLGVEKVGVRDNFFELGGHSLMATQVLSRIRDAFEIELPLRDLFESPTVERLAQKLGETPCCPVPALTRFPRNCVTPISFTQEQMWFREQMHPGAPVYNIPVAMRLEGELNVAALEGALNEILKRHDVFRMTFKNQNGRPVAVTQPMRPFSMEFTDLSGLFEEQRERESQGLASKEATRPFNLEESPLLRAHLVKLGAGQHVLLLTTHHIVFDGWSLGVFYRELASLYGNLCGAFTNGHTRHLPELSIGFADFAQWQRNWLQNGSLERELSYWKQKLEDAPASLDLPLDHARPPVQTFRGAATYFSLGADLSQKLNHLGRRETVTLFMLLLAAFQALLHRYSGQETILTGSPVAGRGHRQTEHLVGLFLNTIALRSDFTGDVLFRDLLQQVKRTALEAFAHDDVPFEKVVDALQRERDTSRPPLVQVMFVLQNEPLHLPALSGLKVHSITTHNQASKFDLELSVEEGPDGLVGNFEYNTDLFDATTIDRMIGHLRTLLESIVENPAQKVSMLPLLTASERQVMVVDWNSAVADYPAKCVHELFEEQVARTPDAVALVFDEAEMTYRELNDQADRFASQLRALGVGPETRVGICVERSFNMLVGVMGILKAGGGYVPLDPTYPKERLQFMLEDAQAPVLVTQKSLGEHLKFQIPNLKTVWIDESADVAPPASNTERPAANNLCYVIYTSGSTGQPKGVMVTHRNVVNLFAGLDRLLGGGPGVWISVCSMSFDLSVTEFFYTLARGSKVVIKPDSERVQSILHGEAAAPKLSLPELMVRHGVTHWQSSVSMMRSLALTPDAEKAIRPLKKVLLGGEPLSVAFAKQLREMMSGDLINLCGPTETTVWCQAFPVTEAGETNPLPIGRPFVNTQMYLLDGHRQPVPIGVPGEIYIAGDCVSRGYLNRPEMTAKKYLPNPFGAGRLYASGDVGRFRPDGVIEIIGRSDFQVKIRGHRIELGEIELALTRHPAVHEAVVMAYEASPGDKRLVAYPVLKPANGNGHAAVDATELRKFLEGHLPEIMVPSAIVFLDKLPLTPSGKVNRKALPAPEIPRANGAFRFTAPVSELEQSIAKIWQELLHVEKIGLQDNFFDLGGHSLLVVEAQAKLRQALGVDLPVVKLFQYPTISSLAGFLREKKNDSFEKVHERCRLRHAAQAQRPEEENHLP